MSAPGKRPTVLVVDDDRDSREASAEFLRFSGFDVVTASDGEQALIAARSSPPDVVILDLQLPRIDGFEVTRRLKKDPRTRDVPVLAVSACVFPEDQARALESGCERFFPKPCELALLLDAIRELVKGRHPPRT